jgi:hypothetical protein
MTLIATDKWIVTNTAANFWGMAINDFSMAGDGYVTCEHKDGKDHIELTTQFFLEDRYDFKDDPEAPAGYGLTDADWHRMERVGLARSFRITGSSSFYHVKWIRGEEIDSIPPDLDQKKPSTFPTIRANERYHSRE